MDVSHLLDELNEAQREAVTVKDGHVLVLAGAGSGKTRVLIHRLAWLIQVDHVSPLGVLAVTFTNKAAGEMRARAGNLLQVSTRPLWIGTFHGIAHRLLRMHWEEAGLPEEFQILDSEDQQRLLAWSPASYSCGCGFKMALLNAGARSGSSGPPSKASNASRSATRHGVKISSERTSTIWPPRVRR